MVFKKGHLVSEETGKRISITNKGKHLSLSTEYKVGHVGWNKGKNGCISEETRRRLSEACKGRKPSEEQRRKMSESHKGKPSGKKGKHLSEETRRKLSEAKKGMKNPKLSERMKGRAISEETRRKMSESRKGEKSYNWQGGLSFLPYCHKFNRELRERIRDRDNRACQLCGVKENGTALNIHHIHYLKSDCEPDLIALCVRCNSKVNFNREYYESLFMEMLKSRGLL